MANKIILYIATSLDGFIARENGSVDWLDRYNSTTDDFGYKDFLDSIDIILMGNTTYKQILTFGKFPYEGKRCYVFSNSSKTNPNKKVEFVNGDIKKVLSSFKDKKIWLLGGANLAQEFIRLNLIDEYMIFVMPIILGTGISLFGESNELSLTLKDTKKHPTGGIKLHYTK